MGAKNINAAYAQGYAHGSILLLAMRQGGDMPDRVRAIHDRYLEQVRATEATEEGSAYVGGFRDAVSDNLPCPPPLRGEALPQRHVA